MSNPNRISPTGDNTEYTEWDDLSEVEFSPVSISTDEVSKIDLSDAPMGEGRQDKRVDASDASGAEKRTSNLMLGYNERGVQIGESYLSIEEFREKALEDLEKDVDDKFLYFVRKDTGKHFAEPSAVVDDILSAITGVGPEATLSDNANITNQDARSVEFSSPNGESQRGVFMLGNENLQMPNGTYAEASTINSALDNYAKAVKKEAPVSPPPQEKDITPSRTIRSSERLSGTPETEETPDKDLRQATLELAELYAKNRRLLAGPDTHRKFEAARQEYQKLLAEHLANLGHAKYDAGFESISSDLQSMASELATQNMRELTTFAGGDLAHPTKTPEEIEAKREELRRAAEVKMKEKYPDMVGDVETTVTSTMIEEYAKVRSELEEATIDALDNGTACRKAVSKIITNKWVKRGLAAAATAGLAVAAIGIGHGLADGSLSVSIGYTAGGVAAGAIRGGLSGALMSRQSSKTSAIRDYGSDDVAKTIEDRINAGEHITAESLAAEAMGDYGTANPSDARSNKIRTAASTGIGAAVGAAASGIHIDDVTRSTTTERVQTGTTTEQVQTGTVTEQVQVGTTTEQIQIGTTPEQYNVDLGKIDIQPGSGMSETFADLGGDPSKLSEAIDIAHQFDAQYGLVSGSNGIVPGVGGQVGNYAHTYPGTIDTWPEKVREYITQVAQKWAENGLIESVKTGGEPIYTTIETPIIEAIETPIIETIERPVFSIIEKAVVHYLPNLFYNAIVQAEAATVSGIIGGAGNSPQELKQEVSNPSEVPIAEGAS